MRLAFVAVLGIVGCGVDAPDALVSSRDIVGDAIPEALSDTPADATRGAAIFVSRDGGHCVLCHAIDGLDAEFQGNVGPALTGLGDRLSPGQIRLRVVDPTHVNAETVMPSYYRIDGLNQVATGRTGKPVLTSRQIEDLVAYLSGLTEETDGP